MGSSTMWEITHEGMVERIIQHNFKAQPSAVLAFETTTEYVIPHIAREKLHTS